MNTLPDINPVAKPLPTIADTHGKRLQWWMTLEPQWRAAFGMAFFRHSNLPDAEALEQLWQTPSLRFVGPTGSYPNLNFELTNCSGIATMSNLEVLVLTHHRLTSLKEVASLSTLKSLFVNNNQLQNLEGVEALSHLEQVYTQANQIESITPLQNLHRLREVYVCLNQLKTLDGLTRQHSRTLKAFFCLPNDHLPDRDVMRVERQLSIRCRSL